VAAARRRHLPWLAGIAYLGLSFVAWGHLWLGAGGPAARLPVGSADVAQDVWWLAWLPHALGQGTNPFFTDAMFWPHGVNVVANPSILLVALVLSPITVTAGPVVAFAVAVTLAPALDALVAYVVFRRAVSWAPAAFVGGLVYGFGPFVATDLRYGHLHLTVAVLPPLLLLVVDRMAGALLRDGPFLARAPRTTRSATAPATAVALAGLAVAQFFVSGEVLALTVVIGVVAAALAVLVAVGQRAGGSVLVAVRRPAGTAAAGALLAGAVLGYPLWWYLRGPRHFSGAVWGDMARFSASVSGFVQPGGRLPAVAFLSGGNGDFLGVGLVVVLVAGALWSWGSDRVLRMALVMALVAGVLALGPTLHLGRADTGIVLPAWPLHHLPVLSSIAFSRFGLFVDLFAGLALARVLDRTAAAGSGGAMPVQRQPGPVWAAVAIVVAGAAVVQPGLVAPWPYPTAASATPPALWRAPVLGALPDGSAVQVYPPLSGTDAVAMAWQAADGLRLRLVDGYAIVPGPHGEATVHPAPDALGVVFAAAWLGRLSQPVAPSIVGAVRAAAWTNGVRAIMVLSGSSSRGAAAVTGLLRAALGVPALSGAQGSIWLRAG
jgi:hypothetical protein